MSVPAIRLRPANDRPVQHDRDYVLYWMIAARRPRYNYGLERAVARAGELRKPLIVFEPLRSGYPWASDRLHAFVLQGMAANAAYFAKTPALYFPYVERTPGEARGLLAALGAGAAVVVVDDFPAFFLRRMVAAAADRLDVLLETVDSNGLVPLVATERAYPTAFAFRRALQGSLRRHLAAFPVEDPAFDSALPALRELPSAVVRRWRPAGEGLLAVRPGSLSALPIDHAVAPVESARGGFLEGRGALDRFLEARLDRYVDARNAPEEDITSRLSPYLHFGHLSTHEVFASLMSRERWTTRRLGLSGKGQREGWWGASAAAEAFLDQVITWRELGYHTCHHRPDYDRFESLPAWAQATLGMHACDERDHVYTLEQFDAAHTHDPLWNAAQVQLRREGRIHNYLRMVWGKKILEWSSSPRDALAIMIELNNRYALDGRDPNSYAGITWVMGRYDRPWAPERPVFGRVRYMSTQNTARKFRVREYIRRYAEDTLQKSLFEKEQGG